MCQDMVNKKFGEIYLESKSRLSYALIQVQIIIQISSDNRPLIDRCPFRQLLATEKYLIYNLFILI